MMEKDFRDYEGYSIETDRDGRRYMHISCSCWQNSGRTRWDGDPEVEEYDTPYTVTEYTFCRIPLTELVACGSAAERWELICDCEAAVQQYEKDFTWEELEAAGSDAPESEELDYSDITVDTPDGQYFYLF